MLICQKLFGVSLSNLAVRFSALADFFWRSLIELSLVAFFSLKKSKYNVSERIFIVQMYYSSNNSPIVTQRKFAIELKFKITGPSVSTVYRWKLCNFDFSASDAEFRYSFASHYSYTWKTCLTCIQLIPMYCTLF